MNLLFLQFVVLTFSLNECKLVKIGIFDNVTIRIRGLDKTATEESILIDFDDSLTNHIVNKPSEIITIENQYIPKLEPNSISDLLKVENLTLVYNQIREIRRESFANLPNLKMLNLSHNAIEEIRQGIFNNLPMLDLYLDHNDISQIGYKAFSHLHLRSLFLNNNKISRWSKDWFADSSVLVLDMSFNRIDDLPSNSFHLMAKPAKGTMSLIFSGNQLRTINNDVFNGFLRFRRISLDRNSIEHLGTSAFSGVKYVRTLNLNNNRIWEIGADLLKNTQVKTLMLEDNKLTCLSTDLFPMEELDIDGNPISCFCVKTWLDWREHHSDPSIYHITNLEQECI